MNMQSWFCGEKDTVSIVNKNEQKNTMICQLHKNYFKSNEKIFFSDLFFIFLFF